MIADIVLKHHERACALAGTATTAWLNDYKAIYPTTRAKWIPGPIAQLHQLMHEQYGNKEKRSTKIPAVAKGASKTPLEGPCLFGHTFTTLRCNGKPQWLPNPDPPLWEGTPVGRALCQRCYIQGRTAAARRRREQPEVHNYTKNKQEEPPSSSKRRRCLESEAKADATRALKATPLYPPMEEDPPQLRQSPPMTGRQLTISTARPPGSATARPPEKPPTSSSH